jgi:hypothetical protein
MKKIKQFLNPRAAIVLLLAIGFFLMHHFVFLNGNASQIALIMSSVDEAYDFPGVTIDQRVRPDYLHPFRPVIFIYHVESSGEEIIEKVDGVFSNDWVAVKGDAKEYFDAEQQLFMRPLVAFDYANWVFFLVQYFILIAMFVLVTNNPVSRYLFEKRDGKGSRPD